MKKLVICIFLLFSVSVIFAQVSTPSLDPVNSNLAPSASAWRYGTITLGLLGATINQKLTQDDSEYAKGKETDYGAILAAYWKWFNLEAKTEYGEFLLELEDEEIETRHRDYSAFLAVRLEENIAVSGGVVDIEDKVKYESGVETTIKTRKSGLGLGFRFWEFMHVAMGFYYVESFGNMDTTSDSYDVTNNTWRETYYGISVLEGDVGKAQIRVEAAYIASPEDRGSPDNNSETTNHHPKTQEYIGAIELKYLEYLIHFSQHRTVVSGLSFDSSDDGSRIVEDKYGLAYISQSGIIIGLYYVSGIGNINTININYDKYQINLGVNF